MYLKEAVGDRVCVWKEAFELGGRIFLFSLPNLVYCSKRVHSV